MRARITPVIVTMCLSLCSHSCSTNAASRIPDESLPVPTASPSPGEMWIRPRDGMRMVFVPGGEFMMGSDYLETGYARKLCREYNRTGGPAACTASNFGDESPAHAVILDSFWIDRTEVTNGDYVKCEQQGACTPPTDPDPFFPPSDYGDPAFDNHPVVWVTREQASVYCRWAGGRLPTEAEWEYAARGPESHIYPWGDIFDGTRLNYCDVNCAAGPNDPSVDDGFADAAPVGSYPNGASWVGALDMAGNVREWVADPYGPYSAETQINPTGPEYGDHQVPHGGSWMDLPYLVRSANRGGDPPGYTRHNVGFRCVRD